MKVESVAERTCAFGPLTRGALIALIALLAGLWLAMLGARSLVSADEGRYATLSLGMLQSGDWIVPRLNGLLYFEKPPLQYWAGALSMAVFGVNAVSDTKGRVQRPQMKVRVR